MDDAALADHAARMKGYVGEQLRARADDGVAPHHAAGADDAAGTDDGAGLDHRVHADRGAGINLRAGIDKGARMDADWRLDLMQGGEILRRAREIHIGIRCDDARAGVLAADQRGVGRREYQRRSAALGGLRAKFAIAEKADVRSAGVGQRRDPCDFQVGIARQLPAEAFDQVS